MGPGMDAPGGLEVRVTSISTGIDLLLVRRGTTLSCFRAEAEQAGWHAPGIGASALDVDASGC